MDEIKEGRNQFTFYRSFFDAASVLPKSKRLGFYEAMIRYALDEKMPDEAESVIMAMFTIVKPTLDSARKKAEACARGGMASAGVKKHRSDDTAVNTEATLSVDNCNSNIENKKNKKNNINTEKKKKTETEIKAETESKCRSGAPAGWMPPAQGTTVHRSPMADFKGKWRYGDHERVRLTTEEYFDLMRDLGMEETDRCISFVDYEANGGRYDGGFDTDWAGEVRRCSAEKRYIPALAALQRRTT